jgi:competence protein ComFC
MRCYACAKLSLDIICEKCWQTLFPPTVKTRTVGTLDVISFYRYSTLEPLLLTKHIPEGYSIYKALGKRLFAPFIDAVGADNAWEVYIVGIDEYVKNGYAHVALLTRAMKRRGSIPQHASLLARNRVSYAGKPLQYRLENPRAFVYTGKPDVNVILVDDIITTGITLQEAQKVLTGHGINILFALTLADAQDG